MSDSIRLQIIEAVIAKVREIRKDKGYLSDMGKHVGVYFRYNDAEEFVAVWPQVEGKVPEYESEQMIMPVKIEGARTLNVNQDKMRVSEEILADIIENILGDKWLLNFSSGGSHVPSVGEVVIGETGGGSAIIESIDLQSGTWEGQDASGVLTLRRKIGEFISESLEIGGESDAVSTDGSLTFQSHEDLSGGGLVDEVEYVQGGLEEYPEGQDVIVGMSALFNFKYPVIRGNPYSQP